MSESATCSNPNTGGTPNTRTFNTANDILVLRVADLATGAGQAKTKGNCVITDNRNGNVVVYTVDFSELKLEPRGSGEAVLTPMTGKVNDSSYDEKDASEFQKNLAIELRGDTFYFKGELTPVKWTKGWITSGTTANNVGYYVWFDVDAEGIAGAKAWSVRGKQSGNAGVAKGDIIFRLGDENLKESELKEQLLYVLTEACSDNNGGTPDADTIIKTYKLDFSGVTLKEAEPFTVNKRGTAEGLIMSLLCNEGNYDVSVDYVNKKIMVSGDLYQINQADTPWAWKMIDQWFEPADMGGYYVAFDYTPESLYSDFMVRTSGAEPKYGSEFTKVTKTSTAIIRIAYADHANPRGTFEFKLGEDGKENVYQFDFSGVNWKTINDRTEPTEPQTENKTPSGGSSSSEQG